MSGRENSKKQPTASWAAPALALNQQSAGVARVRGKLEEGERTGIDCLYLTPPPETSERGEERGGGGSKMRRGASYRPGRGGKEMGTTLLLGVGGISWDPAVPWGQS